jgi:hypothetical protein
MEALSFLVVIAAGIVAMLISLMLDNLWAQVLPVRSAYYLVRAPGVVVHECAHILGCLLTGATVKKVVLFSKEGGSVTYARPKIPVLGDVIISSAPLFCIPLVLFGLAWAFSAFLGCTFPVFPETIDSADTLHALVVAVAELFRVNLVASFNPWFLLYLYLALSLVLSLAPSGQDIRNAAIGIALVAICGILVFASGVPWAVGFLWQVTAVAGMGFALALAFGLVALVVSLPVLAWYAWAGRRQTL